MFKEEFVAGLATRFKAKNDDERNRAFREDLDLFTMACPENYLQDVFNWVRLNHKFSTPFLLSKIYDYAKEKGYIEQRANGRRFVTWHTCVKCGTHYTLVGRGCPKCRELKASISTGETYPEYFEDVTEDCFYCTIYQDIKKNSKWTTFNDCGDYGKKQDQTCSNCQCKECCRQMMIYNADQKGTIEKYRTGELAQPWLYKVDPLNETVKMMVNDIARRRNK